MKGKIMVSNAQKTKTRRKLKKAKMGKSNRKKRLKGTPPFPIHQDK
jgi:hypothetical protein